MRRLEQDDQYVNPHCLYLTMFCPSSAHVLLFDPRFGVDTARQGGEDFHHIVLQSGHYEFTTKSADALVI